MTCTYVFVITSNDVKISFLCSIINELYELCSEYNQPFSFCVDFLLKVKNKKTIIIKSMLTSSFFSIPIGIA